MFKISAPKSEREEKVFATHEVWLVMLGTIVDKRNDWDDEPRLFKNNRALTERLLIYTRITQLNGEAGTWQL